MITSDEAKNIIELSFNEYITVLLKLGLSVKLIERWKEDLIAYISQQETLQAEHEALKKDVARYFELEKESFNPLKARAYVELYGKLIKVGKEEWVTAH